MNDRALRVPEHSVGESGLDSVAESGPALAVGLSQLSWVDRFGPRAWLLGAIRLYQLLLSPLLGPRCRFYPSCSHYAAEALRAHGVAHGSWLAAQRVCRCHPFNPGGYDPVPPGRPVAGAESGVAEGRAT